MFYLLQDGYKRPSQHNAQGDVQAKPGAGNISSGEVLAWASYHELCPQASENSIDMVFKPRVQKVCVVFDGC